MKIYTVQKHNFLENIDLNGFVLPPEPIMDDSIFFYKETVDALHWLECQYDSRIKFPRDRNLIWVWPRKRMALNSFDNMKEYSLFTFEVPMYFFK